MAHLDTSVSSTIRFIAFWLANGTIDCELLEDRDYSEILTDPSGLEMIFAITCNLIEVDESGCVTNAEHATKRVAQYIRSWIDDDYVVDPPFEEWELELH